MSINAHGHDLLSTIKDAQTPLFLTLVGFRQSIARHLGLKELPLVMHNNPKAVLRREVGVAYPYGYFKITSFGVSKEGPPNKTVRRHSSSITLEDITNATINKGYLFPCDLEVEFHYFNNDPYQTLLFIEKASILGAVNGFSFQLSMPEVSDWQVSVEMSEGPISIPDAQLEDESEPAAFDISINFTIRTKVGITKSVAKINNEGRVTRGVVMGKSDGEHHEPV